VRQLIKGAFQVRHGAGYSGVETELFHDPRTAMLFGDAKKSLESLESLVAEVKAL
jgi:NAD/NADP transhydrogenase beta subunit